MAGYVKDLIDGTVSLDGSPVAAGTQNPVNILRLEGGGWRKRNLSKLFESYATQDFLDNHVDHTVLEEGGVSPAQLKKAMLAASYKPERGCGQTKLRLAIEVSPFPVNASFTPAMQYGISRTRKILPAMAALGNVLPKIEWLKIIAMVRGTGWSELEVSGKMPWPLRAQHNLPYSDLGRAS
eukprot:417099_1